MVHFNRIFSARDAERLFKYTSPKDASIFRNCVFKDMQIKHYYLIQGKFQDCIFSECKLSGCKVKASFKSCNFQECYFSAVDFQEGSSIQKSEFVKTKFWYCSGYDNLKFYNTNMWDEHACLSALKGTEKNEILRMYEYDDVNDFSDYSYTRRQEVSIIEENDFDKSCVLIGDFSKSWSEYGK